MSLCLRLQNHAPAARSSKLKSRMWNTPFTQIWACLPSDFISVLIWSLVCLWDYWTTDLLVVVVVMLILSASESAISLWKNRQTKQQGRLILALNCHSSWKRKRERSFGPTLLTAGHCQVVNADQQHGSKHTFQAFLFSAKERHTELPFLLETKTVMVTAKLLIHYGNNLKWKQGQQHCRTGPWCRYSSV